VSSDRAKATKATKMIKTTAVSERWVEFLTRFLQRPNEKKMSDR